MVKFASVVSPYRNIDLKYKITFQYNIITFYKCKNIVNMPYKFDPLLERLEKIQIKFNA